MSVRLLLGLVGVAAVIAIAVTGWATTWLTSPPAEAQLSTGASVEAREHLRKGIELARQGLHDGAAAELRRYVSVMPDDPDGHFHLGRALLEIAYRRQGPIQPAIDSLEQALELDPTRDYIRLQLAEVYGIRMPETFRPERAIQLYEALIQHHPDRFDVRLKYAQWLVFAEVRLEREGKGDRVLQDSAWTLDLARHHLEKTIDLAPRASDTAIEARTLLGEVQFRSGEWDAARATFEDLITGYPSRQLDLAPGWNTIGHCHWRQGNYAKAAEAFTKAWDLTPIPSYLYDLRMAYEMMGGYPDDLPARYRIPLREENVPREKPALQFEDIAKRLHINKYAGAGPGGWADYDGDGQYDLIACGCDTFCTLFRADGDKFVDATIEAKLTRLEPGFGAAWADYDNDGDPDLYIARNGWNGPAPNSLLRNDGGVFSDVAVAARVADEGSSFHAAWLDYDRDGWLDLVVSNGVYLDGSSNQLYRNQGDGTFRNVTAASGLSEPGLFGTIGVAVGDYDDDAWPDIFFHGRMTANRLYRNQGNGTFRNVAASAGVAGPGTQNGYVALMADFDSDGDLDIFTGSLAGWDEVLAAYRPGYTTGKQDNIPRLYRNDGDGTFTDTSLEAGLRYPIGIMAAGTADLDNDGYLDLYLGTGNPELRRLEPNIFYHNRQGRWFEDITRFTKLGFLGKGHGIIFLDWDEDGDLDMFAELGGFYHGDLWESAFLLNKAGNRNNWLSVNLSQPSMNRNAVGARVTLTAGSWKQVQEVTAGRGFSSTDPPILHFGLGKAARVDHMEIRWPDGTTETREDLDVNRSITIRRAAGP